MAATSPVRCSCQEFRAPWKEPSGSMSPVSAGGMAGSLGAVGVACVRAHVGGEWTTTANPTFPVFPAPPWVLDQLPSQRSRLRQGPYLSIPDAPQNLTISIFSSDVAGRKDPVFLGTGTWPRGGDHSVNGIRYGKARIQISSPPSPPPTGARTCIPRRPCSHVCTHALTVQSPFHFSNARLWFPTYPSTPASSILFPATFTE